MWARAFSFGSIALLLVSVQEQKLAASDAAASEYFGISVALSGDTAVVGGLAAKAYVLTRSGATWSEQTKLTPSVAADGFGSAVALAGDTAVVGARDFNGTTSGTAFPFVRSGTTWSPQGQLMPSDGAAGDAFGAVVALSQDTAVVGAQGRDDAGTSSGAAYVFVRAGTTWTQQQKLTADDAAGGSAFGATVAVDGDTAVVGASGTSGGVGAAYVFTRTGTTWTQQQKLTAAAGKRFGAAVALRGDTIVVGQPTDIGVATGGSSPPGSAYVFTRAGTTWTQQTVLSGGVAGAYFGSSVAVAGSFAVVGATGDTAGKGGLDVGAAYVFRRVGGTWASEKTLTASDGHIGDQLSRSLSLDGDTALVGAPNAGGAVFHAGAAYAWPLTVANGSTCAVAADCPSGFCVDGVCCDTACGGGANDCNACSAAAGAATNGTCGPAVRGTQCRAAAGACDAAEVCDGATTTCPADAPAPDGTTCDLDGVCAGGTCKASSSTASSGSSTNGPNAPGGGANGPMDPGAPTSGGSAAAPIGAGGDSGCSVHASVPSARSTFGWLVALAGAAALRRRRR